MDEIVYRGKRYTRSSAKWVNSDYMVVHENLQIELNKEFIKTLDLSEYSVEELIEEGDKFKESATYYSAIKFYEEAMQNCDEEATAYILPRISSCYRHAHEPRKAVEMFALMKKKYGEGFITPVLLTSVAAAYCDLHEYENALRCCRWAYKRFGGFTANLSAVYGRIKKESGLE